MSSGWECSVTPALLPHYLTFSGLLQCPQVQTKGTLYHATVLNPALKNIT